MPRNDYTPPLGLKVSQVAGVLGMDRKTVYDLVRAGSIPTYGDGQLLRVPKRWVAENYGLTVADIDAYLKAGDAE